MTSQKIKKKIINLGLIVSDLIKCQLTESIPYGKKTQNFTIGIKNNI